MSSDPGPLAPIFSIPGAAIMGALTEALALARASGCDCQTCVLLRGAVDALDDITRSDP